MASIGERITMARDRYPALDRVLAVQDHYGKVNASQQAGGITYFAFLSFFPLLALAFFVVGYVAKVYPGAQANLVSALQTSLPGLVNASNDPKATGVSLMQIQDAAGAVGIVGAVALLYAGLGWVSALRTGLIAVFELPRFEQPSFVGGKVRDLSALGVIGLVLLSSVALSSLVVGLSGKLLDLVDLSGLSPVVVVLGVVLGLGADTLLFLAMFTLLTETETPRRSLVKGAVLGAVGFEVLKLASTFLIKSTSGQPAFQAFGIALILVVWINYFSRLVLYAAAFAYTTPEAVEQRGTGSAEPVQGPVTPSLADHLFTGRRQGTPDTAVATAARSWVTPFAAGGAAALGLVALMRKRA